MRDALLTAGALLLGLFFLSACTSILTAFLFSLRAEHLGYALEPRNRPFAVWFGWWPATFGLLDFEVRLSRKDRLLRVLFLGVLWINRLALLALVGALLLGIALLVERRTNS